MEHPFVTYRTRHELTQAELGAKLGITQGMVAHIENKRRAITPLKAKAWEPIIGIPREKLCPKIFGRAA